MKCPICTNDFYGNLKRQGVVYRKRNFPGLIGDIWVCNQCLRNHSGQEHTLIEKMKDLDPAEIYDSQFYRRGEIKGGLFFYIFCVTILSPFTLIWFLISASGMELAPSDSPIVYRLVTLYFSILLTFFGIGICVGILLWRKLKPYALTTVKLYLWSFLVYQIIFLLLPIILSLPSEDIKAMFLATSFSSIMIIAWVVIWLIYFNSGKVKLLYQSDLYGRETPEGPDRDSKHN